MSRTANFTAYTTPQFTAGDQARLQQIVIALALYDDNDAARGAGLKAVRVPARRAVDSNPARRGVVDEYLIMNLSLASPLNEGTESMLRWQRPD